MLPTLHAVLRPAEICLRSQLQASERTFSENTVQELLGLPIHLVKGDAAITRRGKEVGVRKESKMLDARN